MDNQTLINNLNYDLTGELQSIIFYITYSARFVGPHRPALMDVFRGEIDDELQHAEFLADKIKALGSIPVTTPRPVPITPMSNRDLVMFAYEAELTAVRDYTQRAQEAREFGDIGLATSLENIIVDETDHKEKLQLILEEWLTV